MARFHIQEALSGNFIDVYADLDLREPTPEAGIERIIDVAYNVVMITQRKRSSFKYQIICHAEFKVRLYWTK